MTTALIHFYRNDYSSLSEAQENGGVYTASVDEDSVKDSKHAAEVALYAAGLDDRIIIVNAEPEKKHDELKNQLDVLTYENETNHECYVNLLFSSKSSKINLQAHDLEQQAKGVEDFRISRLASDADDVMLTERKKSRAVFLRDQAKALKEQGQ